MSNMNPKNLMKFIELPFNLLNSIKNQNDLNEFKKIVTRQRRILAKKYHPDHFPNYENLMKDINAACDLFLKLQLFSQPQVVVRYYYYSSNYYGGTTTANTWT